MGVGAGTGSVAGPRVWCCVSLQTGCIAVATANTVATVLAFAAAIETVLLPSSQAFISMLVSVLVVFVLLVVNAALMAGAVGRKASFVFPWLVTYAVVIIASVVAISVTFNDLEGFQGVGVVGVCVLFYFYAVVAAFCHELVAERRAKAALELDVAEGNTPAVTKRESRANGDCLIVLEDFVAPRHDEKVWSKIEKGETVEKSGLLDESRMTERDVCNDTFTDLVCRSSASDAQDTEKGLNDSGEYADPFATTATAVDVTENHNFSFLPQPEEIIQVSKDSIPEPILVADLLSTPDMQETPPATGAATKAVDVPDGATEKPKEAVTPSVDKSVLRPSMIPRSASKSTSAVRETETTASATARSRLPIARANKSVSGIVLSDIDANFSPFKRKGQDGAAAVAAPKMKIFLPKAADDDDSEDEDSSDSSADEDNQKTDPKI